MFRVKVPYDDDVGDRSTLFNEKHSVTVTALGLLRALVEYLVPHLSLRECNSYSTRASVVADKATIE
jgi:hypothetical protein